MNHLGMIITGTYDLRLVTLSYLVAVVASFTALDLAGRLTATHGRARRYWLMGGAVAMGLGIWSMHFIGMLAFSLPAQVSYDGSLVFVSMIAAVLASGLALSVVSRRTTGPIQLTLGGICMGLAIVAMHYIGMAALTIHDSIVHYNLIVVATSVAIAIAASLVALIVAFWLRDGNIPSAQWWRLGSAFIMGAAITGMHYTGMAAIHITSTSTTLRHQPQATFGVAVATALVTLMILGISLVSSLVEQRFAVQAATTKQLYIEVAERERTEAALHESEARFRILFEHSPDALFLTNPHHPTIFRQIVDCNAAACQMNGYNREDLIGKSINLLHPAQADREDAAALVGRLHWTTNVHGQTVHRRKDGSNFPIEYSASLVPLGKQELILSIDRDMTQREKVDQLKNEFISTVSHELRTPLTSIRGALGLVTGGITGPVSSEAKVMLDIAYKNSERLVRLINDILDIERIESGKIAFDLKPQDLMIVVEQALDANRSYGAEFGITFLLAQRVENAVVNVDADLVMQALTNLLSNAAKFSPRDGVVTLAVTRHGYRIRVAVTDNGPGIPKEFHARIFQKFAQADSSDTRQKGGSGLGLSITKTIVEKLGGQIGFTSEAGVGTTFYIDLPAWHTAEITVEHPLVPRLPRILRSDTSRANILHVEDDLDLQQVISFILQDTVNITWANNIQEAKHKLSQESFDLLILDIGLPDGSGLDMLPLIPERSGIRIPVIFFSAQDPTANTNRGTTATRCAAIKMDDEEALVERVMH